MEFKGTKSEQNIKAAFAGESQARNKYTYYADAAKKEGHDDIAELFRQMAENELVHARLWFKLLQGESEEESESGNVTADNLLDAAKGENEEWMNMYPGFAATAREEGLNSLAEMFERVATIESDHERRFLEAFVAFKSKSLNTAKAAKAAAAVEEKLEVRRSEPVKPYRCVFCGSPADQYLDVCPVCKAIGAYQRTNLS